MSKLIKNDFLFQSFFDRYFVKKNKLEHFIRSQNSIEKRYSAQSGKSIKNLLKKAVKIILGLNCCHLKSVFEALVSVYSTIRL